MEHVNDRGWEREANQLPFAPVGRHRQKRPQVTDHERQVTNEKNQSNQTGKRPDVQYHVVGENIWCVSECCAPRQPYAKPEHARAGEDSFPIFFVSSCPRIEAARLIGCGPSLGEYREDLGRTLVLGHSITALDRPPPPRRHPTLRPPQS